MRDKITRWKDIVHAKDYSALIDWLAEDVTFHSPFVWKPKEGKDVTGFILSNVLEVIENFEYHRGWEIETEVVLEFSGKIGSLELKGIDLISFNPQGQIGQFEVLIRPANALMAVGEAMSARISDKTQ